MVAGRSLLERVWRISKSVSGVGRVVVATDDERISAHVAQFGGESVLTSPTCRNGSERVFEAVSKLRSPAETIVNVQGDAVLMPPWVISALVEQMRREPAVQIATPAVRLSREQLDSMMRMKAQGIVSGTTVAFDAFHNAMYFSKAIIPFMRSTTSGELSPVYQHIGVYAYRPEALKRYISLPAGAFEEVEQLEQLRALEHGMPIRVVEVSMQNRTMWSVDNPQDVSRCEAIIKEEGELV